MKSAKDPTGTKDEYIYSLVPYGYEMNFSARHGYKPAKEIIQLDSMDDSLRNGLWSLLKIHCWDHVFYRQGVYGRLYYLSGDGNEPIRTLCERLWFNHFKEPLDQLSNDWEHVLPALRQRFFGCEWYEVYDFVEFVASNYNRQGFKNHFTQSCNSLFEQELSAYRFTSGKISRLTDKQEVHEIDEAIQSSAVPVRDHLQRALELLSDRSAPDYRNSIKESISAVESLVATTVRSDKGTLGQLLKKLENEIGLHPALKAAFGSLYGYTSDESGIRHALTEEPRMDFNDAKFMLVVCSAFVNFVAAKLLNSK